MSRKMGWNDLISSCGYIRVRFMCACDRSGWGVYAMFVGYIWQYVVRSIGYVHYARGRSGTGMGTGTGLAHDHTIGRVRGDVTLSEIFEN